MSYYGPLGISMDRYTTLLSNLVTLCEGNFGSDIDTDEEKFLGHMLRQVANQVDLLNQKIQQLYDAMSVSNNAGVPLDNVLELINMSRQSAAKSISPVTLTASKACTIPAGKMVRTDNNVYWLLDEEIVFTGAGTQDTTVTCTEYGPYNADIGDINTIVTTVNGWTGVTNAEAATPGRDRELDSELKSRHQAAVSASGERDTSSMSEAVGNVAGVSAVLVTEDHTSELPISVYVIGGDDDLIASAIDGSRPAGTGTAGTTSIDVYSSVSKQIKTIRFFRAADVDVYISLWINVNAALFPADGVTQIKAAIETLMDEQTIGDDVVYNKLPSAIYSIPGVTINQLLIGLSSPPSGQSDIEISNTQRAVIDVDNIEVNYA